MCGRGGGFCGLNREGEFEHLNKEIQVGKFVRGQRFFARHGEPVRGPLCGDSPDPRIHCAL